MNDEERALWNEVYLSPDWETKVKPALEAWIARQARNLASERDVEEIRIIQGGILMAETVLRLPERAHESDEPEREHYGRRRVRAAGVPAWAERWLRRG